MLVVSIAVAALLVFTVAAILREPWRSAPFPSRLLALSGIPLALSGAIFVGRFAAPSVGPYLADARYPWGPYLNTWIVSFGFGWVALGVLFSAFALLVAPSRPALGLLGGVWLLCWFPHLIIGIGFALAGDRTGSVRVYEGIAGTLPGLLVLGLAAAALLAHWILSVAGFALGLYRLRPLRRAGSG